MSLKKKTLTGLLWTFGQQVGVQGVNFIVQIILARLLMPEAFGLISMIFVFNAIGNSLVDGGMTSSLIRSKKLDNRDYSTVFFINIGVSLIVYFILFFLSKWISVFYNQPELEYVIKVYCLVIVIQALNAVQTTKLTKEMNFKLQMMMQIPSSVISGICAIILAYYGHGVWSLVWMYIINSSLYAIQCWIFTKWRPSLIFDKEKFKYHFNFGYKLTLSGLLSTLYSNLYRIIIGKFYSANQLGFYHQANSLSMFPVNNITRALNKVSYPLFSKLSDNPVKLLEAYKMISKYIFWIICPIMIYLIIFADHLFRIVLTEKWLPAVPYFQILCLSVIFYPHSMYSLNILAAKGRSDLHLKIEIYKKSIGLIVLVALMYLFGMMGVVIASAISLMIGFVFNSYNCGVLLNYSLLRQILDFIPTLTISVGLGFITKYLILSLNLGNDIINLVFTMILFGLFYFSTTLSTKVITLKELTSLTKSTGK